MKLMLEFLRNKINAKRSLQFGLLIALLVGIFVANAAKEQSKAVQHSSPEPSKLEHEHVERTVILTDEQLKNSAIELARVGPASIHEIISLYGTVALNGEKIQRAGARFNGSVRSVNKRVGDTVKGGEILATIESNESLKTYSIASALSGVVTERHINVGEQTNDQPAFVIADFSTVWVEVSIFPRDATKIHIGQIVRIKNPANEFTGQGEIISVATTSGSANQSLTARVLLNNTEHEWTPGIFVNADVLLEKKSASLAIRNEALQDHEGMQVVFIKEKNSFEPRPVTLGRTDGEITEVLNGIKAGEVYASKNSFVIKAEMGKGGAEHD